MSITHRPVWPATALAIVLLAASPAAAFDATGDSVADAFLGIIEAGSGGTVSATGATTDGGVTTIEGFSAETTEDGETLTMTADSVTLTDAAVAADGGMTAGKLDFGGVRVVGSPEPFQMDIGALAATNVRLDKPADADAGLDVSDAGYDTLELTDISVRSEPDNGVITIESFSTEGIDLTSDTLREGKLEISTIVVPLEALDDDDLEQNLTTLGYDGLTLDIMMDGKWRPQDGGLVLDTVEVTASEMGTLSLTAEVGGLTESVLEQLQDDEQDPNQALALLNEITVAGLTVNYADAGLASRLLTSAASSQGVSPDAFADQLSQMLPQMLSAIGNQAFESEVAGAATTFLKDPKNLKVVAAPTDAVPISQIVGAAMMSPGAIPNVLSVTVTANE